MTVVGGAGACGGGSATVCNVLCSNGAGGAVDQTSLTSPIVALTADPSCSVTQIPADAGEEVFVSMIHKDGSATSGSCKVRATLADGSTWVAVLAWAPSTSECCGTTTQTIAPYPKFTRAEAGV